MALENVGLGGVLTFDNKQAVAGMKEAGDAADGFSAKFGKIGGVVKSVAEGAASGFKGAGTLLKGIGVASLPIAGALTYSIKKAADFEHQMSAVGAVTRATAADQALLAREAKHQGATTAFSAVEAGEGMELLGRAGFHTHEIIDAIGPTLNLASADGIGLAESANVVSNSLHVMGLDASHTQELVDKFALATHSSNTRVTELGDAFRYAGAEAKVLHMDLTTTTALLEAVANAGLKGTTGGTGLAQALVQLTKPSKQAAAEMERLHIGLKENADGSFDAIGTFKLIHDRINSIPDVIERARVQTTIFGVRGQKAFEGIAAAIDTGKLDEFVAGLNAADGVAAKMAARRLDNLTGAFTLLRHEVDAFAIEAGGFFLGPFKEVFKDYTKELRGLVLVMQDINDQGVITEEHAKQAGPVMIAIALGIRDGMNTIIKAWQDLRKEITDTIKEFAGEQSPEMIQQFAKVATIIGVVLGATAPLVIALGFISTFIGSSVIPGLISIGEILVAIFTGPAAFALGGLVVGFMMFRREGESVGQTLKRLWDIIVSIGAYVMDSFIQPMLDGFKVFGDVFDVFSQKIQEWWFDIKNAVGDIFGAFGQAFVVLKPVIQTFFHVVGLIVGAFGTGVAAVFTEAFDVARVVIVQTKNVVLSVMEAIINFIKGTSEYLGKAATLVGLKWGKDLEDFGKGTFRFQVGQGEQGMGFAPETKKIAEASSEANTAKEDKTKAAIDNLMKNMSEAFKGALPKEINVNSKVCVDGKTVAVATAKHQTELSQRAGFKSTPWQRRVAVEHGATPVRAQ